MSEPVERSGGASLHAAALLARLLREALVLEKNRTAQAPTTQARYSIEGGGRGFSHKVPAHVAGNEAARARDQDVLLLRGRHGQ